MVYDDEDI